MPEVKPNKPIPIDPNRNIGRPPKPETIRRYYQNNPDVWLEKVFGITLWDKQREILRDVWNNRYVAVKSCFASGKSFLGACLVMAFSHLWPYSVVLTTARTFRQVRANIWQMVHWLKERARIPLGSEFLQTEIRLAPGWYALGFSTDDPGTIQGIHPKSGKILIIVDESAEVDAAIIQRLHEALMTSDGAHILHIGNPLEPGTIFHAFFSDPKFVTHTISAFDTPNVKEGREVIPGLVSRQWVEERRQEWGEDSPMWYSRVLGEFPPSGDDTLIPLSWVQAARERWYDMSPSGYEVAGVDIARYGCFDDQTQILTNEGWKFFEELHGNEKVLTIEPNGMYATWGPITQVHKYPFDGYLNLYDGDKVNFCVTDNHNMLVRRTQKSDDYAIRRFDELPRYFSVRRSNSWHGWNPKTITFSCNYRMPHGGFRVKQWTVDFIDWARFLGWFLSEGNVYRSQRRPGNYRILIGQKNPEKMRMIKELLDRMGFIYRETGIQIEFTNSTIGRHLLKHCGHGASNKRVPKYLKNASVEALEAFLETFALGDGTQKQGGGRDFITSSRQLADDIQEILAKLGRAGKLYVKNEAGTTFEIDGRVATRYHDTYIVTERSRVCDSNIDKTKVKRIRYRGYVYCVSTPLKTILVRRNGCVMWSGNSAESVCCVIAGRFVYPLKTWTNASTSESVGYIKQYAKGAKIIRIDDIGVGGGVVDQAKQEGLPVIGVNVQTKAKNPDKFYNLRAELYWNLREMLNPDNPNALALPPDDTLAAQLTSIKYKVADAGGRIKVESKEEMRARGLKSPDRADALCLAAASVLYGNALSVTPILVGVGQSYWGAI